MRSAIDVITSIAARAGSLHDGQEILQSIERQQWSAFNIPLLWAVAEGDRNCPVLLWLARHCHEVERITVAGVETAGREAVNNCAHSFVVLVLCVFGTCRAFLVLAEVFLTRCPRVSFSCAPVFVCLKGP